MNVGLVVSLLGKLLMIEGGLMIPSLLVSLYYRQGDWYGFVVAMLIAFVVGMIMQLVTRKRKSEELHMREGFAVVALSWVCLSFFGALPFYISGAIPQFINALFESVSGFTTTGATILDDIEALPHALLFWRSFSHWIGGMGVLVFTLAIMPKLNGRTSYLASAETTGPVMSKLVPRMGDTAKLLYLIYILLSIIQCVLLMLAGMNFFDACIHTFSTAGTGGFSNRNSSVGAYGSPSIEWIITIFMVLFGINFSVFFQMRLFGVRQAIKNEELKVYLGMLLVATLAIAANILPFYGMKVFTALRYAAFQVTSIASTTGFATADYAQWPYLSQSILVLLMFVGSCAGSTAGGMKVIRVMLLYKMARREIKRTYMPNRVEVIKVDGKRVEESILNKVGMFFVVYILLLFIGALIISFDRVPFATAFSAALTTLSNVGPGLEIIGPSQNFHDFSIPTKLFVSFLMLCGRLEIFPMLVLFSPRAWGGK